jgi:hypothetical protein
VRSAHRQRERLPDARSPTLSVALSADWAPIENICVGPITVASRSLSL